MLKKISSIVISLLLVLSIFGLSGISHSATPPPQPGPAPTISYPIPLDFEIDYHEVIYPNVDPARAINIERIILEWSTALYRMTYGSYCLGKVHIYQGNIPLLAKADVLWKPSYNTGVDLNDPNPADPQPYWPKAYPNGYQTFFEKAIHFSDEYVTDTKAGNARNPNYCFLLMKCVRKVLILIEMGEITILRNQVML